MKRTTITALAVALPIAAYGAIPPGDELANCQADMRKKVRVLVEELRITELPEDFPITMLAIAALELEIRSWQGADGLERCQRMLRTWQPPPREEKTARPDYRRRYRSAGNELAPRELERIQGDRDYDRRRREFERKWEKEHAPYIRRLEKERPPPSRNRKD